MNNAGGCSAPGHVSAGKNSSTLETNGQAVTVRLYTYLTNWDLLIMFLTIARKYRLVAIITMSVFGEY